jgi:hypothetical protein
MADVVLKANAEVDLLSGKELQGQVDRMCGYFEQILAGEDEDTVVDQAVPFKTTSAGKGSVTAYRVPAGYDAFLTRLVVDWPTASAKTGGTACTVRICADTVTASSTRSINNTIPSVFDASRSHAPLFRGGQSIVVGVTGGPHTTTIFCSVQVILVKRRPLKADVVADEQTTGGT